MQQWKWDGQCEIRVVLSIDNLVKITSTAASLCLLYKHIKHQFGPLCGVNYRIFYSQQIQSNQRNKLRLNISTSLIQQRVQLIRRRWVVSLLYSKWLSEMGQQNDAMRTTCWQSNIEKNTLFSTDWKRQRWMQVSLDYFVTRCGDRWTMCALISGVWWQNWFFTMHFQKQVPFLRILTL